MSGAEVRGVGYLTGLALMATGVGQAIARDWLIDGWFLLLVIAGAALIIVTVLNDFEDIPEGHPDQFGSLDRKERGL